MWSSRSEQTILKMAARNTLFHCKTCKGCFLNIDGYVRHECVHKEHPLEDGDHDGVDLNGTEIQDSASQDTAVWGRNATLLLTEGYRSREPLSQTGKLKKKALWKLIETDLKQKGYPYSASQVESRWKSLTRSLRTVLDGNSKSGSAKKTHPYEEELAFLAARPNVTMENVVSTTPEHSTGKRKAAAAAAAAADDDDDDISVCATEPKTKKKLQYTSQLSQVLGVMNNFISMSQERHEREIERQNRMHEQKMDLFRSYIEHLQK